MLKDVICIICGDSVCIDLKSKRADEIGRTYEQLVREVSDISGRSLRQMISTVFPHDIEIQRLITDLKLKNENGRETDSSTKSDGACGSCYNLLEQVGTKDTIINFHITLFFIMNII